MNMQYCSMKKIENQHFQKRREKGGEEGEKIGGVVQGEYVLVYPSTERHFIWVLKQRNESMV